MGGLMYRDQFQCLRCCRKTPGHSGNLVGRKLAVDVPVRPGGVHADDRHAGANQGSQTVSVKRRREKFLVQTVRAYQTLPRAPQGDVVISRKREDVGHGQRLDILPRGHELPPRGPLGDISGQHEGVHALLPCQPLQRLGHGPHFRTEVSVRKMK